MLWWNRARPDPIKDKPADGIIRTLKKSSGTRFEPGAFYATIKNFPNFKELGNIEI